MREKYYAFLLAVMGSTSTSARSACKVNCQYSDDQLLHKFAPIVTMKPRLNAIPVDMKARNRQQMAFSIFKRNAHPSLSVTGQVRRSSQGISITYSLFYRTKPCQNFHIRQKKITDHKPEPWLPTKWCHFSSEPDWEDIIIRLWPNGSFRDVLAASRKNPTPTIHPRYRRFQGRVIVPSQLGFNSLYVGHHEKTIRGQAVGMNATLRFDLQITDGIAESSEGTQSFWDAYPTDILLKSNPTALAF